MRLIGTLNNENSARRIVSYLKEKGIESNCEISFDPGSGQLSYQLWIIDEDKINEATSDFERFQKEPSHADFDAPVALRIDEEEKVPPKEEDDGKAKGFAAKRTPLTLFILFACMAVFFLNAIQEQSLRRAGLSKIYLMTPIQADFLYDLPPAIDALEERIEEQTAADGDAKNLAPLISQEIEAVEKTSYWKGLYDLVLLKAQGKDTSEAMGPLFYKLRQGQVWRLFTPCILHSEFLHILFNMIWLWVLGRPIEQRIGLKKTLLLTLIAGVGSNTIQYLMSGPFFIGYSGVVMALAGFIWMRERIAPWEGYPLNKTTVLFLILFIGAMFLLTLSSFFFQITTNVAFAPNIANTAHIAGAVIGAILGRFSYFSQETSK